MTSAAIMLPKTSGCNQGMMIGHANHDALVTGTMSAH